MIRDLQESSFSVVAISVLGNKSTRFHNHLFNAEEENTCDLLQAVKNLLLVSLISSSVVLCRHHVRKEGRVFPCAHVDTRLRFLSL